MLECDIKRLSSLQMLPSHCFMPPESFRGKRDLFTEAEDNLLAMGWHSLDGEIQAKRG